MAGGENRNSRHGGHPSFWFILRNALRYFFVEHGITVFLTEFALAGYVSSRLLYIAGPEHMEMLGYSSRTALWLGTFANYVALETVSTLLVIFAFAVIIDMLYYLNENVKEAEIGKRKKQG
jgi:uncharacterized membrane protein YphA (DoxX/SURF4 family)